MSKPTVTLLFGDVLDELRKLPDGSVNCVVTSPPYYGLRDYGTGQWEGGDPHCDHRSPTMRGDRNEDRAKLSGSAATNAAQLLLAQHSGCGKCGARKVDRQIGLEQTPDAYVRTLVRVFREVRRALAKDGVFWLNIGDTYCNSDKWGGGGANTGKHTKTADGAVVSWLAQRRKWSKLPGVKPKDLIGIPWAVAFALRKDGWYLRSDIVWAKPNPMPESIKDRPTKSHEHVFMLTKSERYWYDHEAVKEPAKYPDGPNSPQSIKSPHGQGFTRRAPTISKGRKELRSDVESRHRSAVKGGQSLQAQPDGKRNMRDVWSFATQPFKGAHFATFPRRLPELCIKAGCPPGGTVLDPFAGSGTTGQVALELGRSAILIELNPEYGKLIERRLESLDHMRLTPPPEMRRMSKKLRDMIMAGQIEMFEP